MLKKSCALALVAVSLAGCVTGQTTAFRQGPGQMALVRDGRPSISSQKAKTAVILAPAARQTAVGVRPTLVVAIQNRSSQPTTFRLAAVKATQVGGSNDGAELKVYSYDELVAEEQSRRVAAAILVGLAAGANAAAAANSSRNPYINNWNQHVAARQNADLAASVAAQGEVNMAVLEQTIIKDNTLMPGEWYGGVMQIQAPTTTDIATPTAYALDIEIGGEHHVFDVTQNPIKN